MSFSKKSLRAFSLAEVLIAIVIITILTVGSIAVYSSQLAKARDTERTNDVARIKLLLDQFVAQYGSPPNSPGSGRRFPPDCKNATALFKCFNSIQLSSTEDLTNMLLDPNDGISVAGSSGEKYIYKYASDPNSYVICALLEDQKGPLINSTPEGKSIPATETIPPAPNNLYCQRYAAPGSETTAAALKVQNLTP